MSDPIESAITSEHSRQEREWKDAMTEQTKMLPCPVSDEMRGAGRRALDAMMLHNSAPEEGALVAAIYTAMHEASTPDPEAVKLIEELSSELAGLLPFLEAHHHSTKRLQELLTFLYAGHSPGGPRRRRAAWFMSGRITSKKHLYSPSTLRVRRMMVLPSPPDWQRLRYRSEPEYRAAVENRARDIWEKREQAMWGDDPRWKNYRLPWERGTELARDRCLVQAQRELGQ